MAPALLDRALNEQRDYYCDDGWILGSYGRCYRDSNWNRWGRWVALAVIIGFFLLLAFSCSCLNARRRRRQGMAPRYGTGWLSGKYNPGQQHYQNNNYHQGGYGGYANPAPPYSPPSQPPYGGGNNEYYGGQQSGIELQQPQNAYQPQYGAREQTYSPPPGPPPPGGKSSDGIIR